MGHFPLILQTEAATIIHKGLRMAVIRGEFVILGGKCGISWNSAPIFETKPKVIRSVRMPLIR
jgi:hypothetical protein